MNWKTFRTLFVAILLMMLGESMVTPFLAAYAHGLGATSLYIGLVFGAFSLSMSLASPVMGRLSDAKGRKPFLVAGLFLYFAGSVFLAFWTDVGALILIRFLQGIAAAMFTPIALAYAGDITPEGREGLVMGLTNGAFVVGLCIGPLTGGLVRDQFGIHISFLMMGLLFLLGSLICAIFLPRRSQERIVAKESVASYRELICDRHIAGLFVFRFAYSICISSIWSFAPLFADTEHGLSGPAIGLIITVGVLADAAVLVPMGILADRFSKRIFIAVGGLFPIVALVFFSQMEASWGFYVVSVLLGLGDGVAMPAVMAMTVVLGRKKASMGAIMSLLTLSDTLGLAAGPVLVGMMMDTCGKAGTFGGGAGIMLLATGLALVLTAGFHALERQASNPEKEPPPA